MNIIAALLILILVLIFAGSRLRAHQRRRSLLASPLSESQRNILHERVPLYKRLPDAERQRLEGLVNRFLSEIKFFGADDLEITEEIRVTIAAQACLLIVNKPDRWYKTLETIIVYPGAFKSRISSHDGHLEWEHDTIRSGESWDRGPVILSWDHAAYGAFIEEDGQNVVYHEFAHQLDQQTGIVDGAPQLDKDHAARDWAIAFRKSYAQLVDDVKADRATFLDPYGATSPAEFFAVATEVFFEKPEALREREPDLYAELSKYYELDPASWRESA